MSQQFSAQFLDRYEIIRVLGEGGMGTVYLSRQKRLDRLVAVKVVKPDAMSKEEAERLQREAVVLASLDHPNILGVHDVGIDNDVPFMVCEYVDGETLSQRIARKPSMNMDQAMRVISMILSGLKAAHHKGIIHRDIKPQNIFLTKQGKPKIGDFGLAKKQEMSSGTVAGAIMGSPPYMSPEQCRGFKATASSDLYSVGIMLFEMTVGVRPFQGPTLNDYLSQHTTQQAPWAKAIRQDLPEGLAELLSKALEKDPGRRFASASSFRRELMAIYRGVEGGASVNASSSGRSIIAKPRESEGDEKLLGERYRLERLIGEGGMGQVWLANDDAMDGQEVAVKILPPELWRDPEARENLKQEAKLSQRLSHPNVVRLMTLEPERDGSPAFLVMEYVPGPTLAAELIRRKFEDLPPFSPIEALPIIEGMCGALELAHQKNLVHRDIKPSNILLDPQQDGTFFPKLADFGIAAELSNYRARRTGAMPTGTLAYMSPEQLACQRIDGRADLYSLGATIYQMMTFSPPYVGGDVGWAVANAPVPRPDGVPDNIADFVVRCLAKNADDRPATARDLAREYRIAMGLDPGEISWPSIDPSGASGVAQRPRVTQGLRQPALPQGDVEATMPGFVPNADTEATMNAVPGQLSAVEKTLVPGRKRRRAAIGVLFAAVVLMGAGSKSGFLSKVREQLFGGGHTAQAGFAMPGPGEKIDADRFIKGAEAGDVTAQRVLGILYRDGRGVPQSDQKSLEWLRRAAEAGDTGAQVGVGTAYARGRGVEKSDKLALEWFRKAAVQNDATGLYNVGIYYRQGRGIAADVKEAVAFFQKAIAAAQAGAHHAGWKYSASAAQFQLGDMYLNGQGVTRDEKQAFDFFRKAAENQHPLATFMMATMYYYGQGVKTDAFAASTWVKTAASLGVKEASDWMAKHHISP
jgi:serine/threonine protein kinase/TPR repeat protein